MTVLEAFGLRSAPFTDISDDSFFFPSDQHLGALEFIGHVLWTRTRLGVVTAAHGCGKSLLITRLLRDLDERVIAASVTRENIGPREFLLDILRQFGFSLEDNDKTDRRRLLERFLHHQAAMGRVCLLVVENAQSMHPTVLEELRYLTTVAVDGVRILKVVLLGQPALNHVLESPRMAELMATNVPRFSLGPLSEDQTAAYVAHRLRAAGASDPDLLMPSTLMPAIYRGTGGVATSINRLCEQALACAAADASSSVTEAALERAFMEMGWSARGVQPVGDTVRAVGTSSTSSTPGPNTPSEARLMIAMQGMAEREVNLSAARILIGRGEEADVRIDSVFVSRYHALIVRDGHQDLLLDLGSTNGLLVNSRRILRRALRHRDLIQVGPAKVTYFNPLATAAAQPHTDETICFARPGFPMAAGEEGEHSTVLAFGRLDTSSGR